MTSKTFSCQLCHVEFITQAKLVKHEKKIHANLIDLKPDTECGRHGKPSEHQNFEKHLLIAHAGEDSSECLSKNEQVFVNKSNLISEPGDTLSKIIPLTFTRCLIHNAHLGKIPSFS